MYALIKAKKADLKAEYKLPSTSDPRELVHLDGSNWVLVMWDKTLAGADVYNEVVSLGGLFFDVDTEEQSKALNKYLEDNFFNEEISL